MEFSIAFAVFPRRSYDSIGAKTAKGVQKNIERERNTRKCIMSAFPYISEIKLINILRGLRAFSRCFLRHSLAFLFSLRD